MHKGSRQVARGGLLSVALLVAATVAACGSGSASTLQPNPNPPPSVTLTVGLSDYTPGSTVNYGPSDTIDVTIHNRSTQTIYFPNHKTDCTVMQLQIQITDSTTKRSTWQDTQDCAVYTASTLFSLAPQGSMPVQLPPLAGFWQRGSYQAELTYVTQPGDPSVTITSDTFNVTGAAGGDIFPGPAVTATPDLVTLTVVPPANPPLTPNDNITVMVNNGSGTTVWVQQNSDKTCTFVLLQWEGSTNTWTNIDTCAPSDKTSLVPMKLLPNTDPMQIVLKPLPGDAWPTGVFRVALLYSAKEYLPPTCEVSSAGFIIAASQVNSGSCTSGGCGSGS
jgi:hypothetical protein